MIIKSYKALKYLKFKPKMIFVGQIVFDLWTLTYETIFVREAGGPHLKVHSIEISHFRPIYVFKSLISIKLSLK